MGAVIIVIIIMGAVMMSESAQQREQEWSKHSLATDTKSHCGAKYMSIGNDECVLNPELVEPNTVIIYDVTSNDRTRMSVVPHSLVMNLTEDHDTITFVNEGANTVNIFDKSKGIWRFDDVNLSSQRILTINGTGFYEFLVQNSRVGENGVIVALSDDTNSLPVETRAKMAQTIVFRDSGKEVVGLIGVGSGGAEPGITVKIHERLQDEYGDAEKFYHEKYRNMIPFDVPIRIEFGKPSVLQTG